MIKWDIKRGRVQRTTHGTTRAYLYYYVIQRDTRHYEAGRYWLNREVAYTKNGEAIRFSTIGQARAYCEAKDREAVIIEAVTA
jgi:hypothetical protein